MRTSRWKRPGLLCTWREVYGGFGDFQLQPGDDLLIFGAGPVGLSFVKFGRMLGLGSSAWSIRCRTNAQKAAAMGADATYPPDADLRQVVADNAANRSTR